jgi:hypothetical protein
MTATDKLTKLSLQLEAAKTSLEKLKRKSKQLDEQQFQTREDICKLQRAIEGEKIKELINVENAVCYATVGRIPKLDNLTGTVLSVGRRYAKVRFENGEVWQVGFSSLCRAQNKSTRDIEVALF